MSDDTLRIDDVQISVEEATETLRAIRSGSVDAVVVSAPNGHGVVTFHDPDHAYRALVQAMGEGAALVTPEGVICYCNARFAASIAGTGGLVGQALRDLVPADASGAIDAMLLRARRGPARIEVGLVPRDGGQARAVQLTASVTAVADVEVVCVVATDLSEQRAQAELYREALIGMAARERLISIAGHELRAPIQGLVAEIAVMRAQHPATEQLESIQRLGSRLAGLVETLLDVRLLGSEDLELAIEEIDLAELVRDIVAQSGELARSGSRIDVDARSIRGRWDRLRLGQVIANLLSNAARYGLSKPVRIVVDGDDRVARLVVEDRGIGVAPNAVDRLFRPFERIGSVNTATGLGLGLYITAQIVKAHRGVVRVESHADGGSRFVVELPYS